MRTWIVIGLLGIALLPPASETLWAQAYYPPGATLPGGGIAPGPGYRPPGATQPDTGYITPAPGYRPPGAPLVPGPTARGQSATNPNLGAPPSFSPSPRLRPVPSATPAPVMRRAEPPRVPRARPPARNLKECLDRWSPKERISQSEWETTCRRLEVSGRVFKE